MRFPAGNGGPALADPLRGCPGSGPTLREAGRYAEAADTGRKCLDIAGKTGNTQFVRAMEPMIRFYQRKAAEPSR